MRNLKIISSKKTTLITTLTTIKKRMQNKLNKKNKPLLIIPISAENLTFDTLEKKDDSAFTFIYSGSYGVKDGVDFLIDAFTRLSKKHNDARLFLAGQINDKTQKSIAHNSAISYKGLLNESEYYNFISKADVLLMTRINSVYSNTGFPFKLGEYLATENAVIATKVSDVELYLKDKEDVIFADPSDVNSLVEAMEYAINHRTNLFSMM